MEASRRGRALRNGALALAGALSLALASCGGDDEDGPPSEPPAELLRAAVANPAQSADSVIAIDAELEGDSLLAGSNSLLLQGPYALDADASGAGLPSFDFAMEAEVAGFGVDGALVSTPPPRRDAFVVFFGENYRVGPERVSELNERLQQQGGDGGLGLRIDEWFRDPEYAGSEEVAGTESELIEGTLDSRAAAADLAALADALGAPPLLRELVAGAEDGPIEAWVADEDDTIRRLRVQFPFAVPAARQAAAGGINGGAVTLDAEIANVGTEVTVEPPPGGGFQPIEDLIEELRDLASLGGL